MRVSSKEDLVGFLEDLQNKLEGLLDADLPKSDIQDTITDLVNEIKDTLYWV